MTENALSGMITEGANQAVQTEWRNGIRPGMEGVFNASMAGGLTVGARVG